MQTKHVAEFNLSVTTALRDQLLARLSELEQVELVPVNLEPIERRGGVYQLFEDGKLVYVGKSAGNLRARLEQHMKKLLGRQHGIAQRVGFRCVYVAEDLDAVAPEKMLIGVLRNQGQAAWNSNGFGNKDPGRNRDTSLVEASHFDSRFPIDLNVLTEVDPSEALTMERLFEALKRALPYNFRYAKDSEAISLLRSIQLVGEPMQTVATTNTWMTWIMERLPQEWATVALPGYIIAYPSLDPQKCASRTGAWTHDSDGNVQFIEHMPTLSSAEVPNEDNL